MKIGRFLAGCSSVVIMQAVALPAIAQDAAQDDEQQAIQPQSQGLNTIVVTARRVEESSQRAAVPVDVVDGGSLLSAGVSEAGRLDDLVPALTVQPSGAGNVVFIRGVGNFNTTPVSDPAVAFNYDGVYVGRISGMTSFYDLERVEVLKGPQGTLYGRNATGGAINVIPARPKIGQMSGYASASYGSFDAVNLEGAINAPVGDDAAIRLSGNYVNRDGYYDDGTSDDDSTSLRAQVMADLSPELTVRLAADYSHQGGAGIGSNYVGRYQFTGPGGYVFVPSGVSPSEGLFSPDSQAFRQSAFIAPSGRFSGPATAYPKRDNDFYGINAEIVYEADFGTFTVIPAWRYSDQDYTTANASFEFDQDEIDEQVSLEVRFDGERIGIFDYMLGGYFYNETIETSQAVFAWALLSVRDQNFETTSIAPFARVTANLSDRLRLVGGIRYTDEKKTFDEVGASLTILCQNMTPTGPSCPDAPLFSYIDGLRIDNLDALPFPVPEVGQVPPLTPIDGGAAVARANQVGSIKQTDSRVTWRAAIEFDASPDSLLYASVETGFRSGGIAGTPGFETFGPENITAYTIGSKNRFLNNRLQFNVEGFYWEYADQQANFVGVDINGNTAQRVGNIGSSTIKGVELETRFLATPTTLLSANVQYLDTKVDEFVYQTPSSGPPPVTACDISINADDPALRDVDCSGFPGFNSPKWTLNLAAQQTIELGDYDLILAGDTQYKSKRYQAFNYTNEVLISGNWSSNAQITFAPVDKKWSISGYVRNIENDRIPSFMLIAPLTNFLVESVGAPRTWGVRASYNF